MEAYELDLIKKEESERVDENTLSEAAKEGLEILTSFVLDEMTQVGFTPSHLAAWLAIRGDFSFIPENHPAIKDAIEMGWGEAINHALHYYNENNIYGDVWIDEAELFRSEIESELNKKLEVWDSI